MKIKFKNKNINTLFNKKNTHKPNSVNYKNLKKYFINYFKDHSEKKNTNLYLEFIGKFKLPFYKMGNINSSHLLGVDEIIIFTFYYLRKNHFKNVSDLGANIGMHSIILGKLGFNVRSYEPDQDHSRQFKKNINLNKLNNVKLIKKAVDIKKGEVTFTKILNNTTGSFIKKAKKNTYGPIKKYKVKTEKFLDILKWSDMIKMDVEGLEADLIKTINSKNLLSKEIILEVGTKDNAKKILGYSKKNKFNLYSQKTGWKKVRNISDMPYSYKDGSLIITNRSKLV